MVKVFIVAFGKAQQSRIGLAGMAGGGSVS